MLLERPPVLKATVDTLAKKQDGNVDTLRQIRLLSLGLLDTWTTPPKDFGDMFIFFFFTFEYMATMGFHCNGAAWNSFPL